MALQRVPARMAFGRLKQTVPNSAAVPADVFNSRFAAEDPFGQEGRRAKCRDITSLYAVKHNFAVQKRLTVAIIYVSSEYPERQSSSEIVPHFQREFEKRWPV
jgi:hypothetical protein